MVETIQELTCIQAEEVTLKQGYFKDANDDTRTSQHSHCRCIILSLVALMDCFR